MQVATTNTGLREHEQPMSWARALVLATGFFFLAIVLIAQIPGYFYTVSTLATLARFEQGTLDLGLLALGFGVLCFEISMLYDPKPLVFPELFAGLGVIIAGVGGALVGYVYFNPHPVSQPREFLPATGYLFSPIWFQAQSIDISSVGLLGLLIGGGMFTIAILCRPILAGKLSGAGAKFITRLLLVVGMAILGAYLTLFTFAPKVILGKTQDNGAIGNVLLFIALAAFMVALMIWILPVMVGRRQQFMPGVYLHGVVGLIGTIAVPLLVLWAAIYPLVYLIRQVDSAQFFVQCSQKNSIPASCTFTQYTGYIICAIVVGVTFQVFALALYFWSTRRNTVLTGATIGLLYTGLAVLVIHVDTPAQTPLMLFLAAGVALLAYFFTTAGQREFAVIKEGALGCTGQWLLLGTGVFIYLAGFALISMPGFFESEQLGLYYIPGSNTLHDAFWGLLLMSGLAAMQFTLLATRRPMSQLRKFVMWVLLVGVVLQIVAAIQGFSTDILSYGWDVAEGSHAVFIAGLCCEVVGLGAALFGAGIRASSLRWFLIVALPAVLGGAGAYIAYYWPGERAEVVVLCFILCTVGAFAYAVAGPDWSAIYGAPEGYGIAPGNGATVPAETHP
jgi:hypothetical protein